MKRRAFLQLISIPALAAFWPRAAPAQPAPPYQGLRMTDSDGNTNLTLLYDNNLTTGIEYQP